MNAVEERLSITEVDGYGVASVPISAVSWPQWCALGELYSEAVEAGQCLSNGSTEAYPHLAAGGWNLVARLQAFDPLAGAAQRIVGSS